MSHDAHDLPPCPASHPNMTKKLDRGDQAAEALQNYTQAELQAALNPRELTVLKMRAGVHGPRAAFAEVGRSLGVNRSRARAMQNEALAKLRRQRERHFLAQLRQAPGSLGDLTLRMGLASGDPRLLGPVAQSLEAQGAVERAGNLYLLAGVGGRRTAGRSPGEPSRSHPPVMLFR